jgi:hypothetical protein
MRVVAMVMVRGLHVENQVTGNIEAMSIPDPRQIRD